MERVLGEWIWIANLWNILEIARTLARGKNRKLVGGFASREVSLTCKLGRCDEGKGYLIDGH